MAFSISMYPQTDLSRIGQTPGGASYHVNYHNLSNRLFVGCGTSLWVFDMTNPAVPVILAKRPFTGLINESILYNSVLFIAATHDGVYALDATSDTLAIIDHYPVTGLGDIGAYDMCRSGDTLFIADKFKVQRLKYSQGIGFTHINPDFAPWGSFCVAERGSYIAVGKHSIFDGTIEIYNKNNLSVAIASWSNTKIQTVQNLRFSDSNNNIIYICGGPANLFTKSYLFALELSGNQLNEIDSFEVTGIPIVAQANITGIDSRNDTLYIATTCAVDTAYGFPLSYVPIIDASNLPADTMTMIDYINPGLWHFDVSLMDGTPYLSTASEWLGVAINNITTSQPLDTLPFIMTGGWTQKSKVIGDTLWAAHEGWGLAAYNIDSLKFINGYMADSKVLHLYSQRNHFFVADFEFLNDTLLILSNGTVYNLKPWQQGGQPDSLYKLNCAGIALHNAYTNMGQRLIVGTEFFGFAKQMSIFDPFNQFGNSLKTIDIHSNPKSLTVVGDIVFYGFKPDSTNSNIFLAASKIENDDFVLIDTIQLPSNFNNLNSISIENNIVTVGSGNVIAWYTWDGAGFTLSGSYFNATMNVVDVSIKNKYLYIADKFNGVKIFDILQTTLAAQYEQKSGWCSNFGYQDICVGNDGQIYLSDFNAGVIIIERFDQTLGADNDESPLGIVEDKLHIYPNPSSSNITIEFSNPQMRKHTINIYDCLGQLLMSLDDINTGELNIETGIFKSGIYFIELRDGQHIFEVKKIVIE